jgi:uncharacterized protein YjiS (DUF1127 family)
LGEISTDAESCAAASTGATETENPKDSNMLGTLKTVARAMRKHRRRRELARAAADLDDHMLKDIGLPPRGKRGGGPVLPTLLLWRR